MPALSSACSNAMVSGRHPAQSAMGLGSKVKAKVQLGDADISRAAASAFTLYALPIDDAEYSSSFLFVR